MSTWIFDDWNGPKEMNDGWFVDPFRTGRGESTNYLFSADGITTYAPGTPGWTVASNLPQLTDKNGGSYDTTSRRSRKGDSIKLEINESESIFSGLPDHPYHGKKALTQTLSSEVEGIEWEGTGYNDTFTIDINSPIGSIIGLSYSSFAGDDVMEVSGYLSSISSSNGKMPNFYGSRWDGGTGYDILKLSGSIEDWEIEKDSTYGTFSVSEIGFRNDRLYLDDVEEIQSDDMIWRNDMSYPIPKASSPSPDPTPTPIPTPTPQTPSSGSSDGTIIYNIVNNNTNNNTNTTISNSGSGNIQTGNIGTVENITNIQNTFTIQTVSINLSNAITGDSKKKEDVIGTSDDDILADGKGKDSLTGGAGADSFVFTGDEAFKKKLADEVTDFDASEGDSIVIAEEVVSNPVITGEIIDTLADTEPSDIPIAETRKELKQLSDDGHTFILDEQKGELLFDENGTEKGLGDKGSDPLIADLGKSTELTATLIDEVVEDLEADPTLTIAESKKELKQLAQDDHEVIYFEPTGELYVDGNGSDKGFGGKSDGGLIAELPDNTILSEENILIGI